MSIRDKRQQEAIQSFLTHSDKRTIINAAPRFGKIRCAIGITESLNINTVLLLYPRKDILKEWVNEYILLKAWPSTLQHMTFASIKNLKPGKWDLVIIDEIHEMSKNQQAKLAPLIDKIPVLGLSGTMTNKTRNEVFDSMGLDVCYKYSIDEGVKDGILADYNVTIHKCILDTNLQKWGTRQVTEAEYFRNISYLRRKKASSYLELKLINIIQNSEAKYLETKRLIDMYPSDRILVFCGVTKIADRLGVPVYHSKNHEKRILHDFCQGKGDKLATIKMMQAGITIKPIQRGIINYMSGNPEDSAQKICRFLGFEYDNPNKVADIHIVSTDEEFELSRMKTGLMFFDKNKIKGL